MFFQNIWKKHPISRTSSPTGYPACIESNPTALDQHLRDHFRMHPDVHYQPQITGFLLSVRSSTGYAGCIQYRYVGTYEAKQIHLVDCFCVAPAWKKKGVGTYLLRELHNYMKEKPYAIFVKEGAPLWIPHVYEGRYVYCETTNRPHPHVTRISMAAAYHFMDSVQQCRPFFMIRTPSENQQWLLYRNKGYMVLCCVQDTRQTLYGKTMGWMTAWIHVSVPQEILVDASDQFSAATSFDMIWMDGNCVGTPSALWMDDGSFYWYTYQWKPKDISPMYCFLS
jgi:GNAT superfamily N-acetyltransferase